MSHPRSIRGRFTTAARRHGEVFACWKNSTQRREGARTQRKSPVIPLFPSVPSSAWDSISSKLRFARRPEDSDRSVETRRLCPGHLHFGGLLARDEAELRGYSVPSRAWDRGERREGARTQRKSPVIPLCAFAPSRLCVEFFLLDTPATCFRASVMSPASRTQLVGVCS